MAQNSDQHGTRSYLEGHFLCNNVNKKVTGKMKVECAGKPVAEFVGLQPKMYSLLRADGKEVRRSKGVKKVAFEKYMHEQYKDALFDQKMLSHGMNVLRSQKHRMYM